MITFQHEIGSVGLDLLKNLFVAVASAHQKPAEKRKSLREVYPFLNDPGCPLELQALVTQRITSYHQYRNLWIKLFECDTPELCAEVAGKIVDAYIDNRDSFEELEYYKKNGKVLGKHPIFKQFKDERKLRSMSNKELIALQKKLKNNIWRAKSEIAKEDKPHLLDKRRLRIKENEWKLEIIKSIIGE